MKRLPGVRLSLVSSTVSTPYSGMLPGLIAGHYTLDDIHIDLRQLCEWAGVRFIEQTVSGLDLDNRLVQFTDRPALGFDVLSLDTGSTPDLSVPGSQTYATPVKPVHNFHARWLTIVNRLQNSGDQSLSLGVVGSGAGGFELVTAMRHALPESQAQCYWFLRSAMPLSGRPERVGRLAIDAARSQGIHVVTHCDVSAVESGKIIASDAREFELDEILWCTAAMGPAWPGNAGLETDKHGFVATNDFLQSRSHPFVFATGDVGTQIRTPSAKAGVFAVRQAPILFNNIRCYLQRLPLKAYTPQSDFLSLMATGDKRAIASWRSLVVEGDWVWRWKDYIDQTFMQQFKQLPRIQMNATLNRLPDTLRQHIVAAQSANTMPCKGCGAKVGSDVLDRVIASLQPVMRDGIHTDLSSAGDVAVFDLPAGGMVQSVDQINAIVDDPYVLGRIAALHALSDVFTLKATPHSAQVIVGLPTASDTIIERDLLLLMNALVTALNEHGCALIGGHTTHGDELSVGVVVNALLDTEAERTPAPLSAGDAVILTQAIGVGTLFAGSMQQQARGEDVGTAMGWMQTSNQDAATLLRKAGACRMTDVTGFGLLGHLKRLLDNQSKGAIVDLHKVPLLPGALNLAKLGVRSSLWPQNQRALAKVNLCTKVDAGRVALLCDPQTGGGLLAVVPQAHSERCVQQLVRAGYADAAQIGTIESESGVTLT